MEGVSVKGMQEFMGIQIPIIEGGFGDGQRILTVNTVSEIHGVRVAKINELIDNNISEFEIGVDLLDFINTKELYVLTKDLGINLSNRTKHFYILSEQGYMALVQLMRTEKAKEIRKRLRREYFSMRKLIQDSLSVKDKAILAIVKAQTEEERVAAMSFYETKVTAPLQKALETAQPKAEYFDGVINKGKLISTTTIAKDLGLRSAQELNKILKENRVLYKKSGVWHPYANYDFLTAEQYCDYQSYKEENANPTLKWTEKGRKWIIENFKTWNKLEAVFG